MTFKRFWQCFSEDKWDTVDQKVILRGLFICGCIYFGMLSYVLFFMVK